MQANSSSSIADDVVFHLDGVNCSSYLFIIVFGMPLRLFKFTAEEIFKKIQRVGIKKIVCGDHHVIVLLNDGTAFAYGEQSEGELIIDREPAVEVPHSNIHDVYCGKGFTYCLIKKSNYEFRMVSFGPNKNNCCSQRKEEGDRYEIYCHPKDVYYWNDRFRQPMEFPPSNEIILDVKCADGRVAILTKHYKGNQRFLYSIGIYDQDVEEIRNKYLVRRILGENFETADYLTLLESEVIFHTREGKNLCEYGVAQMYSNRTFSKRFELDYFGKLFEVGALHFPPRYQILTNVKIEKISNDLAALSTEGDVYSLNGRADKKKKIEFYKLFTELDKKRYEMDKSTFDVDISSNRKTIFILVKRGVANTKEIVIFKKLLRKNNFTDVYFNLQENFPSNCAINSKQTNDATIIEKSPEKLPQNRNHQPSLGSIGNFFLFSKKN